MSQYIVYYDQMFFRWSDITKAPLTCGMTRAELEADYLDLYGQSGPSLARKIEAAQAHGTDVPGVAAEPLLADNKAGRDGRKISIQAVLNRLRKTRDRVNLEPWSLPGARDPA